MFALTAKKAVRIAALALTLGVATTTTLTSAHANGRSLAWACIFNDDCSIVIGPNGTFQLVILGRGIIWCGDLKSDCIPLPDSTKNGNPSPVAGPITTTSQPSRGPTAGPTTGSPVNNNPAPPKGTIGVPVKGQPTGFHPPRPILPPSILKSIGNTGAHPAPILLVARGGGHHR